MMKTQLLLLLCLCLGCRWPFTETNRACQQAAAGSDKAETEWLRVDNNHIYKGKCAWHARGASIFDGRSCEVCVMDKVEGWKQAQKHALALIQEWKANFIKINMEQYNLENWIQRDCNCRENSNCGNYMDNLKDLVNAITAKYKGVYILLKINDGSYSPEYWRTIACVFRDHSSVLYGLQDWKRSHSNFEQLNIISAIRKVEDENNAVHHVIVLSAEKSNKHFVPDELGDNLAYEIDVNNSTQFMQNLVLLDNHPVILGAFGPLGTDQSGFPELMNAAEERQVPYLANTFHHKCGTENPGSFNMLVDDGNGCAQKSLSPTTWGNLVKTQLSHTYPGE